MKKRTLSLILCFCLLLSGSVFAAGSAEDPLLSLSYAENTIIPSVHESIKTMVADAVAEYNARMEQAANAPRGMTAGYFKPGDSIALRTGHTVIVVSGQARIDVLTGYAVNVTVGFEAVDGKLNNAHRYIICEDSTARVDVVEPSLIYYSASASVQAQPTSPFTDVSTKSWYFGDVVSAYQRGLVNGITASTYEPNSLLRIGQAIKLAACMHQLYHEGQVTIEQLTGNNWFRPYVDYALEKGIIAAEFADYNADITRRQFISIFYNALPESEYAAINSIPDGAIGDVDMAADWAGQVYAFYRAGILTGYTNSPQYADHDFGPDSFISRAEVATIMNRMFDASARKAFTIE